MEEIIDNKWRIVHPARSAPAFRLQSAQTGKHIRLGDLDYEKTILAFLPGIWAPWCRKFLQELETGYESILNTDSQLVAIVSQNFEELYDYAEASCLSFEVLADPHGVINTRYGVFEDGVHEPMKISKPVIFVLDDEKNLHYKFIGRHLMDRPTIEEIIAIAKTSLPKPQQRRNWWFVRWLSYANN